MLTPQWSRPIIGRATLEASVRYEETRMPQWSRPIIGRATRLLLQVRPRLLRAAMEPADHRPGDR